MLCLGQEQQAADKERIQQTSLIDIVPSFKHHPFTHYIAKDCSASGEEISRLAQTEIF
jgi:hypothetical protein